MPVLTRMKRWAMAVLPAPLVPPLAATVALWTDELELHLLDILCDPLRTSVDAGANVGVYSHLLRRWSAHVVAVEPNPGLAAFLRAALPPGRVSVLEMALSDHSGSGRLHVPLRRGVDWDTRSSLVSGRDPEIETRAVEVRLGTLDDLDDRALGFVKIDVEGHGLAVLRGGRRRLRRDRPRVLIEVEEGSGPGSMREVLALMRALDYECCLLRGRDLLPVEMVAGVDPPPATRSSSPEGTGNLIFLPRVEWDNLLPRLRQRARRLGPLRGLASTLSPPRSGD